MKSLSKYILYSFLLFGIVLFAGCKKGWLDVKSNQSVTVPSTIKDFQAVLDNTQIMNGSIGGVSPAMGEVAADDYFVTYANWQSSSEMDRNTHIWADNIYNGAIVADWNGSYWQVYYANIALDGINNIVPDAGSQPQWNNVKGSGLFFRANSFFGLSQLFAKPYDPSTANTDLGIPLRLDPDYYATSTRATVQQTYDQIIGDLKLAIPLLPTYPSNSTALSKTRPSKPAAYALLSRVYLSMEKYDEALLYADSCLQVYNAILNYNTLTASDARPVKRFNISVIFHSVMRTATILNSPRGLIDTTLYASYSANDLRKTIFYRSATGGFVYKGSYDNSVRLFSGITSDEVYLIRAECYARKGNITAAMNDLNALLVKRWKTGTFVPYVATTADDALIKVLTERRKEMIFRGVRWSDLRRLNKDQRFAKTLKRILNGTTYTLAPNSLRYVFPIPDDVIAASGMAQNPR